MFVHMTRLGITGLYYRPVVPNRIPFSRYTMYVTQIEYFQQILSCRGHSTFSAAVLPWNLVVTIPTS